MTIDGRGALEFLGDNTRFGAVRCDLAEGERFVDAAVDDGDGFPLGVWGLIPVVTARKKKGGYKTVYAFPFGAGEPPQDDELARELLAAVDFANLLLEEAAELSGYPFGSIGALRLGIPEKGYCFTRVEADLDDRLAVAPVRLRVETAEHPGDPDTLSAVFEYDAAGRVRHVTLTETSRQGGSCCVTTSPDFSTGDLYVQKVVEHRPGEEPAELYYRRYDR